MNKLTWIVFALALTAGCKSKGDKHTGAVTTQGSGSPTAIGAESDPHWVTKLPSVMTGEQPIRLSYTAGLVRLGSDGSIRVATPPPRTSDAVGSGSGSGSGGSGSGSGSAAAAAAPIADPFAGAKPVQLAGLEEALGLVPVPPRADSPFGVDNGDAVGSAAAGGAQGSAAGESTEASFAKLGHPVPATGAPRPATRATTAFAIRHPNEVSGGVLVFADANTSAAALVDVLARTGGFLAVHHGDALGALPLALDRHGPANVAAHHTWVEIRLNGGIEVEEVPSKAVPVASIDQLIPALAAASPTAVDILVGPNAKVQDVVDVVGALQGSKVAAFGFGRIPENNDEIASRGDHGPRLVAWDFIAPMVDAAALPAFRDAFDKALEPMRGCYRDALAKTPGLRAVSKLGFTIAANAKLDSGTVVVQGATPALAACVTSALKAAAFPQPKGSDGARVLVTLAFLPR